MAWDRGLNVRPPLACALLVERGREALMQSPEKMRVSQVWSDGQDRLVRLRALLPDAVSGVLLLTALGLVLAAAWDGVGP